VPADPFSTPEPSPTCGWFGKLPMLGDFAHRRLSENVVSGCDTWLSGGIACSRQALGERWLGRYLSAPVWRFAWAPRVLNDPSWWFGVLMPSVDAVGRYFPLLLLQPWPGAPSSGEHLRRLDAWYDDVEACAMSVLEPAATLTGFEAALASVASPEFERRDEPVASIEIAEDQIRIDIATAGSWLSLAPAVAMQAMLHASSGHSWWWTAGSGRDSTRVNRVAGLPAPERFSRMLEGEF